MDAYPCTTTQVQCTGLAHSTQHTTVGADMRAAPGPAGLSPEATAAAARLVAGVCAQELRGTQRAVA